MVKSIIEKVTRDINKNISGVERQKLIGEKLNCLSFEEGQILRQTIEEAVKKMAGNGASDIDLGGSGCGGRIWYRINGIKKPDETMDTYTQLETDILCQNLLTVSQKNHLYEKRNLDFSFQVEDNGEFFRYRADLYFDLDHLGLNMRYITNSIRPFKGFNFHPEVIKTLSLISDKQGLILLTGITGSGKSTTLDSIIDANNQTVDAHIVIIASPIETVHKSSRCVMRHREVGRDVLSFKEGAIQSLRQDPDIIVIGEMRDPDTIITALEITDSGHKVFSTLHTGSAVESIDRIIAECPPAEQERVRFRLADTLKCVISQKLVPSIHGGRELVKEIMLITPSIKAAIKNNNTSEIYQMINEGGARGMNTMEQDLLRLANQGSISYRDSENYANNKKRIKELLGN